ncbi:MAG: carboxymuconolactone decarboxylase family protein [Betaproteobacteria bacterium]
MKEDDIDEGIARYQTSPRFSAAEKIALRYSELMALDPDRIDDDFYAALRKHYREEQIVELGAFVGFNIGYHTFFGTLRFYPMFAPDGRLVSQEESARIYGAVPVSLGAHYAATTRLPDVDPAASEMQSAPAWAEVKRSAAPETASAAGSPAAGKVAAIALEDVRDAELLGLIRRGEALGVPTASFSLILAHTPEHAKAVLRAMLTSHAEGNVDHKVKEIIRVRLARTAGDPCFAGLRSRRAQQEGLTEDAIEAGCAHFEQDPRFSDAEKWALRYARDLYVNPEKVDAAFYDEGKRNYSEAQIMELGAFMALHYGMQAYMRTLGRTRGS